MLARRSSSPTATGPSTRPLLSGTHVAGTPAPPVGPPVRAGARAQGRPKPLPEAAPVVRVSYGADATAARGGSAAQRRAVVLLTLAVVTVLSWALVLLPASWPPVWAAAPATVLLGLDLLALRSVARRRAARVVADRARTRGARAHRRAEDAGAAAVPLRAGREMPGRPAAPAVAARTSRPAGSTARSVGTSSGRAVPPRPAARPAAPAAAVRPEWEDRRWEDETGPIYGVERPNPLAGDDGWAPVAVPRPVYTMKPVAPRPQPRPWTAERDFADDLDLDAVLAKRRAVNG